MDRENRLLPALTNALLSWALKLMVPLAGNARQISRNLRAETVVLPSCSTATGRVAVISNSISVLVMVNLLP